jgi:hypothetical protein
MGDQQDGNPLGGNPLDKATAQPPATLGEGCLSRYDLEQLGEEVGTAFPQAQQLWRSLHPEAADDASDDKTNTE